MESNDAAAADGDVFWSIENTKLLIKEYASAKTKFSGTGKKSMDMWKVISNK